MFEFVLLTVLCIILIYVLKKYLTGNHETIVGLQGPSLFELISNVFKYKANILANLHSIHDKYGSSFCVHIKPFSPVVVTSDHNYFGQILASKDYLDKPSSYDFVKPMVGDSLVNTLQTDVWKHDRKVLNEAFNHASYKVFLGHLDQKLDKLDDIILGKLNDPIDIQAAIHEFVLQTTVASVVDPNIAWDDRRNIDYHKSKSAFFEYAMKMNLAVFLHLDFFFKLTENYRTLQKNVRVIRQYGNDMVDAHLKNKDKQSDPNNIIYRLHEAGVPHDRIVDNAILFVEAAHETIGGTLSYCLYEIARNSEVQNKICAEINEIKGNNPNAKISIGDIPQMKYIQGVIKETLRTRPAVTYILRKLLKPAVVDNVTLPVGTNVLFFIDGLHKSKKYYTDPLIFNPDRFSAENQSNLVPNTYAPFSLGVRNCIGQSLAMQKMKFILARLVDRFEFSPVVPEYVLDIRSAMISKSVNGVKVIVKVRGANGCGTS